MNTQGFKPGDRVHVVPPYEMMDQGADRTVFVIERLLGNVLVPPAPGYEGPVAYLVPIQLVVGEWSIPHWSRLDWLEYADDAVTRLGELVR